MWTCCFDPPKFATAESLSSLNVPPKGTGAWCKDVDFNNADSSSSVCAIHSSTFDFNKLILIFRLRKRRSGFVPKRWDTSYQQNRRQLEAHTRTALRKGIAWS